MYLTNWLKKRAGQAIAGGGEGQTRFHIEGEIHAITLEEMKKQVQNFEILGTIEVEGKTYAIGMLNTVERVSSNS